MSFIEPEVSQNSRTIKIQTIRDLQKQVNLRPLKAETRTVILDGAEFLTKPAANCLLKTLEEPPSATVFILITADISRLLPTIRSRCQIINFKPLPCEKIVQVLQEDNPQNAQLIAELSRGSLKVALELVSKEGSALLKSAQLLLNQIAQKQLSDEEIFLKGAKATSLSRTQLREIIFCVQRLLHRRYLESPSAKIFEQIRLGESACKKLATNANARLVMESYLISLRKADAQ